MLLMNPVTLAHTTVSAEDLAKLWDTHSKSLPYRGLVDASYRMGQPYTVDKVGGHFLAEPKWVSHRGVQLLVADASVWLRVTSLPNLDMCKGFRRAYRTWRRTHCVNVMRQEFIPSLGIGFLSSGPDDIDMVSYYVEIYRSPGYYQRRYGSK